MNRNVKSQGFPLSEKADFISCLLKIQNLIKAPNGLRIDAAERTRSQPVLVLAQGKMLESAADWASERQANIAQPKRMSAGQSRQSGARCVGRLIIFI
jgi:hypothetical protein